MPGEAQSYDVPRNRAIRAGQRIGLTPLAYSRTIRWDDGTVTGQCAAERPQLLIENGEPTHLYLATAAGPEQAPMRGHDCYQTLEHTWNMVIPLSAPA